ncbi:hypothetical protein [uncultured Photobacterium sp.]|uniref:hypothetical protein n=1 Tax=uncultured Photobacterium sp. TaxID=173973 RepID=UPI002610EA7B|nr:hypothetical protein [uncultured Photobacterium sp.]
MPCISDNSVTPLDALVVLTSLDADVGYHINRDVRPPLGIYNTSLSRVLNKLVKCCTKLEEYFKLSNNIDGLSVGDDLKDEVLDYIELALYSAAEHVDDIGLIASGFFEDTKKYKKSKPAKKLNEEVKELKSFISASINSIKHQQSRIRMYSVDISHNRKLLCLHGYFIEGVHNGTVGPNKIFHGKDNKIFSITSLVWEIICFILNTSRSLSVFLSTVCNIELKEHKQVGCESLNKAIIAAARLPLYSFDDSHPFSKTRLVINTSDVTLLNSSLYGSISYKWSNSNDMQFFRDRLGFVGDGVTKSFEFAKPISLGLQHWT